MSMISSPSNVPGVQRKKTAYCMDTCRPFGIYIQTCEVYLNRNINTNTKPKIENKTDCVVTLIQRNERTNEPYCFGIPESPYPAKTWYRMVK